MVSPSDIRCTRVLRLGCPLSASSSLRGSRRSHSSPSTIIKQFVVAQAYCYPSLDPGLWCGCGRLRLWNTLSTLRGGRGPSYIFGGNTIAGITWYMFWKLQGSIYDVDNSEFDGQHCAKIPSGLYFTLRAHTDSKMHYSTTALLALLTGTASATVGDWQQCTFGTEHDKCTDLTCSRRRNKLVRRDSLQFDSWLCQGQVCSLSLSFYSKCI
jgi:hypothetical protein